MVAYCGPVGASLYHGTCWYHLCRGTGTRLSRAELAFAYSGPTENLGCYGSRLISVDRKHQGGAQSTVTAALRRKLRMAGFSALARASWLSRLARAELVDVDV